jgi:hypothetical protein
MQAGKRHPVSQTALVVSQAAVRLSDRGRSGDQRSGTPPNRVLHLSRAAVASSTGRARIGAGSGIDQRPALGTWKLPVEAAQDELADRSIA